MTAHGSRNPVPLNILRRRIHAIEGIARPAEAVLPLGVAEIDDALPWGGLPLACLHHVTGADHTLGRTGFAPPAVTFTASLAARLKKKGTVLWCVPRYQAADMVYGPALAALGLDEDALIVVRAKNETEALWAMEEALGCADVTAVAGFLTAPLGLTAERRLQLAAERGNTTGFLVQPGPDVAASTAAVTRWRLGAVPSAVPAWPGLGRPRWSLALDRCRQGNPRSWTVEWCDETRALRLAAPIRHRPADPVPVVRPAASLRAVA